MAHLGDPLRLAPLVLAALVLLPTAALAADPLVASGTQLGAGWTVQRVTLHGSSFQLQLNGAQGPFYGYGMVVHDLDGNGFLSTFGGLAFYEWQNTQRVDSDALGIHVDKSSSGFGKASILITVSGCCHGRMVDILMITAGDGIRSWGYNLTAPSGVAHARTSGPEAWAARARDFGPAAEVDVSFGEGVVAAAGGTYRIDAPRTLVGHYWGGVQGNMAAWAEGPDGVTPCSCLFRDANEYGWPAGEYAFHLNQAGLKTKEARLVAAAPAYPS